MMDPITSLAAIALVCNITQMVEQGIVLAKCLHNVSKTGSTAQLRALQEFNLLSQTVSDNARTVPVTESPASIKISYQIEQCALKCGRTAEQLRALAYEICYKKDKRSPRNAVQKNVISLRKRSQIEELRKEFDALQLLLQTSLLTGLRNELQHQSSHQNKHLVNIDENVRKLLNADIAAARDASVATRNFQSQSKKRTIAKVEEIGRETVQQTKASEAVLTRKLDQVVLDSRQRRAYQRLIDNIGFDSMHAREDYISERVSDSRADAKWIFGNFAWRDEHEYLSQDQFEAMQRKQLRVHRSFVKWLREGTGIWFVGGKPGSGKSTLMSFIRKTLEQGADPSLAEWAHPKQYAVISFFFFRPDHHLERSFEGLWRSLCSQLLAADERLFRQIHELKEAPIGLKNEAKARSLSTRWRVDELREWCFFLIRNSSLKFVVLIDGLDELRDEGGGDEAHANLLRTVRSMDLHLSNVKLICSARPVEPFKAALATKTSFEVQDVNYLDIIKFVNSRLQDTAAASFTPRVVEQADGVFLWTHIVVNELNKACEESLPHEELQHRFELCPKEMHALFRHMLSRQGHSYTKTPLLSLMRISSQLKGASDGIGALDLLFIARAKWNIRNLMASIANPLSHANLVEMVEQAPGFFSEILGRGGGLLHIGGRNILAETYDTTKPDEIDKALLQRVMYRSIQFIHRTALDFLDEDGRSLVSASELTNSDMYVLLALGHMAVLSLKDGPMKGDCFVYAQIWGNLPARLSDIFNQVVRLLEKALITSHPVRADQAVEVFDMFFRRLAERTASDGFRVWRSDAQAMLPTGNALFTCEHVPRDVQYSIVAAQNKAATTSIARAYLVPKIRSLPECHRQDAAALAFLNVRHDAMWELLELVSPFHIPKLYQRLPPAEGPAEFDLCYHQEPMWLHFASYRYFELFEIENTRKYAGDVLEMMTNAGVGKDWQCSRFLVCGDNTDVSVVPWIPQDTALQVLYHSSDQWHMSSLWKDLPRSHPWHIAARTCLRMYRAGGSRTWITVKEVPHDLLLQVGLDSGAHMVARLAFNQLYIQVCVDLVNSNLENLSADLKNMVERGWGFHQGRACHHFSEDICSECGFDGTKMDYESTKRYRDRVKADLRGRHMLYLNVD